MAATTTHVIDFGIADLLGGSKVLGRITEPAEFQHAIREGFPYAALQILTDQLGMPQRDVTAVLGMAARTLARRKKSGGHLSAIESDRLYRIARIAQLAAHVLGDLDKARAWLGRPNRAVAGDTPLSMLDTELGARQVEEMLIRINYGMFA